MAKEAITKALADAKINYTEVQQAVVGYVYGSSRHAANHRKRVQRKFLLF